MAGGSQLCPWHYSLTSGLGAKVQMLFIRVEGPAVGARSLGGCPFTLGILV